MKKGVALALVLLVLVLPVFAQLDLPPPPAPPGVTAAPQPTQAQVSRPDSIEVPRITKEAQDLLASLPSNINEVEARLEVLEGKVKVVALVPKFESRLNTAEQQASVAANLVGRIDALQSEIDALQVDLTNLNQRPYVDQPAFTGGISAVKSSVKKSSILSISLSVITLLIMVSMVAFVLHGKQKQEEEDKDLLIQYVKNYTRQGYKPGTLKGHLLACGWSEELVNSAIRESGGLYD